MSGRPLYCRVVILRGNPLAPDPRVNKIARSLAREGYPVRVIGWNMSGDQPDTEIVGAVTYQRLRVIVRFGTGLSNVIHQLRWQLALCNWLFFQRNSYDWIHACDFDTLLPALIARRFLGKKVVYDIFDFYADMLRKTSEWVVTLLRRAELVALGHADAVILADSARSEQIAGSHPRRLAIIYNSPEGDFLPQSLRKPRGSLHLAYVGNLQIQRGLLVILELLRSHPEWTLDLAGFGADQEKILAAAEGLTNVTWHGLVDYDLAQKINANADVLFAIYDPSIPNNRYSSPNKVFEAMFLGKPLIVSRNTNMDRIVEKANCGLVVPYGDPGATESALVRLQSDQALRRQLGENARKAYETEYAWSIMEKRLLQLYQDIGACGSV